MQDEVLSYEFLQTAKRLTAMEILILKANYEIVKGELRNQLSKQAADNAQTHRQTWRRLIADQMGYNQMDSLVMKYEEHLESLGLISPKIELNHLQSQYESTRKFRLTEMGYMFCEFVTKYQK